MGTLSYLLLVLAVGLILPKGWALPVSTETRKVSNISRVADVLEDLQVVHELLSGRDGRDGPAGRDGLPGPAGAPGRDGRDGADGQKGDKGVAGTSESNGQKGEKGAIGTSGRNGIHGQKGNKGERGEAGIAGPPSPVSGGATYTRWGRTSCPNTAGASLVYSGRAGKSWHRHSGGGGNYQCLPNNPQYGAYTPGVQNLASIYGVEYQLDGGSPLPVQHDHNVPCAVCHVSTRAAVLMIPARRNCPSQWTLEYTGYLMTEYRDHGKATYECVDKDAESVPGSSANTDGGLFYHVEANCNGIPCPPYDAQKELTCAVCTK